MPTLTFDSQMKNHSPAFRIKLSSRDILCCLCGVLLGFLFFGLAYHSNSLPYNFLPARTDLNRIPTNEYDARILHKCAIDAESTIGRTYQTRNTPLNFSFMGWTPRLYMEKNVTWQGRHTIVDVVSQFTFPIDVLDVGANVGGITHPLLGIPRKDRILAVEPVKMNAEIICKTAALNRWFDNGRLTLVHAALSNEIKQQTIYIPKGRGDNAAMSPDSANAHVKEELSEEQIFLIDGDGLLENLRFQPRVIKIDTQGHELFVFTGMKKYLSSKGKGELFIMAEYDRALMSGMGVKPTQIQQLMVEELGYTAYCNPDIAISSSGYVSFSGGTKMPKEFQPPRGVPCGEVFYVKE